jgi:hypothetical protein
MQAAVLEDQGLEELLLLLHPRQLEELVVRLLPVVLVLPILAAAAAVDTMGLVFTLLELVDLEL